MVPALTKTGASSHESVDPVVIEPVGELVLALRLLHRREVGRRRDRPDRLLLDVDQQLEQPRVDLLVREHRELVAHRGEPVAQRGVGADRGGCRVVQLVGQPRRQRAEGQQLLALADDLLRVAHPEEQSLEQVDRHREPGAYGGSEVLGADQQQPGVADDAHRRRVVLGRDVVEVALHGAGVDAELVGAHRLDVVRPDPPAHRDRAGQQHHDQLGRVALLEDGGAGRYLGDPAALRRAS